MPMNETNSTQVFCPPVNITENDKEIVLLAEMPGLSKEDIDLQLGENELTLVGKKKVEEAPAGYTAVLREREPFEYRRTFLIGPDIHPDKVTATYENGVLKLALTKSEKAQPKKIALQ